MKLKTEWARYGKDRQYSGFVVWPEAGQKPFPSVLVIQEAWGVDEHIEDMTRRIAEAGYVALSPDLFSKNGERPPIFTRERMTALKNFVNQLPPTGWSDAKVREAEIAKLPPAERPKVSETFNALAGALQLDNHLPALLAAANYLRNEFAPSQGKKVGAVGFCMGGGLAGRLACRDPQLAGAIIFYGSAPPVEEIAAIRCPILGMYGGLDTRVNEGIPAFAQAMEQNGKSFDKVIYEGAMHAFLNDTRPAYHAAASRDAFARTLEFLRENLA